MKLVKKIPGEIDSNGQIRGKSIFECPYCGKHVKRNTYGGKKSKSCGCVSNKLSGDSLRTHGLANTPEHRTWNHMKQRCLNKNNDRWEKYGGSGIKVCERWMKFENFLADMGKRPEGTTLDRIDNDGDYTPENCRWASPSQQQNNMSTNINICYDGVTKTITEWSVILGITKSCLDARIRRGWSIKRAFTQKVQQRCD